MCKRGRIAVHSLVFATTLVSAYSLAYAGGSNPQDFSLIERGRYLSVASDCISCHTVPNSERPFAGGRAIETPFGKIVTTNITPDLETGIGAWSEDQFDAAVRKGIRRDGSLLYPAMPYNAYTKLSRSDVRALWAYLNTVAPISNTVVANALSFPFNIRAGVRVWNALYFKEGEYTADPNKSSEWNRGAYLVDGPAHCGACHTPKSFLGGDKTAEYLRGSNLQGWSAPDITNNARTGLGGWKVEEVVTYLGTGHNRLSAATGPMAEAVSLSLSKMTDSDVSAIATYLKSLPSTEDRTKPSFTNEKVMTAGGAIYRDQCSSCHGLDGKGVAHLFPSIAESSIVRSDDPTTAVRLVLRGARSVATEREPTAPGMPAFGRQLNDAQVAAVLTYMRNSWGGTAPGLAVSEVSKLRAVLTLRSD